MFTIRIADCLVMKKIGNRPITEADSDWWNFWIDFSIRLNCTLFVDLLTKKFDLILMRYLSFKKFNPLQLGD
jgi:hypothetical protein